MRIRLPSPDILDMINEAAVALSMPELEFHLKSDGLYLNRFDSAKAAHLGISIPASEFDDFVVDEEKYICVSMDSLTGVVKRLKRLKEPIEITIEDDRLTFANCGTPRRVFGIDMLTPQRVSGPKPYEATTILNVDAQELYEQIKDLSGIVIHAIVMVSDGILNIKGEGERGTVSVQTILTESDLVKSHEGPNAKSIYAMMYLDGIAKFVKSCKVETITMEFNSDKPIMFITKVGSGEIRMLVAPRIERR